MGCDGNGGYGNIIAGLEWIAANKQMPAVVSMSITTPTSVSLDQAVNNLVAASGVTVVAAAGNFAQNTCNYSPGRASVSFRHRFRTLVCVVWHLAALCMKFGVCSHN
jgi:subtilisin family serine protease